MHAVMKQATEPVIKERNDTAVMELRRSGAIALIAPIIIPNELGFAKPQIA